MYARAGAREVGTLVTVRAERGGWCFYRSPDGRARARRPAPCGDTVAAAERLDDLLEPLLSPGTFPA
ncbi:hypothetical protein [Actinomadura sediminis]|uniref:Uncharacterized protein n=1 Tax=Actinomadura sediminis TaxID=1038904 RepID=A0ABW3EVZ6_9ACTN